MTTRSISHDEHFGKIGFGSMAMSAADTFSSIQLDAIMEPDLIIKTNAKRGQLDIAIDEVLVWDVRQWLPHVNVVTDFVGGEDKIQSIEGGIVKDLTINASQGPSTNTRAQGTNPGGQAAAVTGTAGVQGAARAAGSETPRWEAGWDFGRFSNEENAAGDINIAGFSIYPLNETRQSPYQVDGNTCHLLLTATHYWGWLTSAGIGTALNLGIGADVKRMSVDVEELFFDRAVLLSILDALVISR